MSKTEEEKTLYQKLAEIQQKLKAPKSQYNKFGDFHYRSCEDILEAVKPLLGDLILTITDAVVQVGERYYIQATAAITNGQNYISTLGFARESIDKKGMDDAQITGSSSSYARKYALNGLFLIDDAKDPDTRDNRAGKAPQTQEQPSSTFYPASDKQLKYLATLVTMKGVNEAELKANLKITSYRELSANKASSIIAILQKRPDKPRAAVSQKVSTPEAAQQQKPVRELPRIELTTAQRVLEIMGRKDLTKEQKAAEIQKIHETALLQKPIAMQETLPVKEKK